MAPFTDHAPNLAATVIVLTIASLTVFPLRVYVRITRKIWGYDDWCILASAVPYFAFSAVCLIASFHGLGVRQKRLTAEESVDGMMVGVLVDCASGMILADIRHSTFSTSRCSGALLSFPRS
jgi:hypothetical protein